MGYLWEASHEMARTFFRHRCRHHRPDKVYIPQFLVALIKSCSLLIPTKIIWHKHIYFKTGGRLIGCINDKLTNKLYLPICKKNRMNLPLYENQMKLSVYKYQMSYQGSRHFVTILKTIHAQAKTFCSKNFLLFISTERQQKLV